MANRNDWDNLSRAEQVRQGDFSRDRYFDRKKKWRPLAPGEVDARHDVDHSSVVLSNVHSAKGEQDRERLKDFTRWRMNNPSKYAEINNVHGDAEAWFHANQGNLDREPTASTEMMIFGGLGGMLVGVLWGVISGVLLAVIYWLYTLGDISSPHWSFYLFAVPLSLVLFLSIMAFGYSLVWSLLASPFMLIYALVKIVAYPFRPAEKKAEQKAKWAAAKQMRRDKKQAKRDRRDSRSTKRHASIEKMMEALVRFPLTNRIHNWWHMRKLNAWARKDFRKTHGKTPR